MNDQQNFWANEYAQDYIEKNSQFNRELGIDAWQKMLDKAEYDVPRKLYREIR